jgi:hypothetical protein
MKGTAITEYTAVPKRYKYPMGTEKMATYINRKAVEKRNERPKERRISFLGKRSLFSRPPNTYTSRENATECTSTRS